MTWRDTRPSCRLCPACVPRKRAPLAEPRRGDAPPGRAARAGCCLLDPAHTGPVATNKFPFSVVLLAGIGLILAIFCVCYARARFSERGTSSDDTPAIGAAPRGR